MTPRFLLKLSLRYSKGHPLQKFLLYLGIAIGVAVVVAIDLANDSIGRSFRLSTQSVTGRATHQITSAENGVEQSLYRKVRNITRNSAPVVTDNVRVQQLGNRMMKVLGIDPFVDANFRNYLGGPDGMPDQELLITLLTKPDQVLITKDLAAQNKIQPGDHLDLQTQQGLRRVTVAGLLNSRNSFTNQALSGVVLADIATAQEILQMGDRISHIDLILESEEDKLLTELKRMLPVGMRVISVQQNRETVRQMSRSFELNLNAMSLLALLVGMFLIYNTVTFSVIQRRFQLGTLRALGTTRFEISTIIISETLFWGILGTLTGLLLGIALGTSIVRLVSQSVSDHYFDLTVNVFHLGAPQLFKAFLLGLFASLFSAFFPAWEASNISPVESLRRSSLEKRIAANLTLLTIVGVVTVAAGYLALAIPSRNLILSFGALLAIVCGAAMLVPFFTLVGMRGLRAAVSGITAITGKMAMRNISRSLSRTAVSIASLMIAVSVIVGVGTMVGSFRTTVVDWLTNTIRADLYISPANDLVKELDHSFKDRLKEIKGVGQIYTIRTRRIEFGAYVNGTIVSLNRDVADREWLWQARDDFDNDRLFQNGWVFLSETFAWKHQIKGEPGTTIVLNTARGQHPFKVGGIFRDFSSEQGIILMSESTYQHYWNDRSLFGVSLFVEEGVDVETVRQRIEKQLGMQYDIMIRSNRGLRNAAIEVFDRTFTITVALQILAGLVAFIGVLNTVMSLMLERSREIGVLRANGLTIMQLWRLVLTESGLIGLISGLFAVPLGTVMAWILVFVINKRSFGWTLEFVLQPASYVQAVSIAIVAALLAGIYPVVTMSRKPVAELLRTE